MARHPANVVRLDLPVEEPATSPTIATGGRPGRSRPGAPMARSTRTRIRRSTSTSRRYLVPGTDVERSSAGSSPGFGSRRSADGAVLPHERTLAGPKEDRYKLLRATGVNTSPVVALYDDPAGETAERLAAVAAGPPDVDVTDDDGVRHRLWAVCQPIGRRPAEHRRGPLLAAAGARTGHDRRRPPSLRDGAALPRRAADVALVRGGPGVRLHPDAVPRGDVAGAAHGPADPPPRARARRDDGAAELLDRARGRCSRSSPSRRAADLVAGGSRHRGLARRRRGPVRAVDACRRGAADRPPRSVRAAPADGRRGRSARST